MNRSQAEDYYLTLLETTSLEDILELHDVSAIDAIMYLWDAGLVYDEYGNEEEELDGS